RGVAHCRRSPRHPVGSATRGISRPGDQRRCDARYFSSEFRNFCAPSFVPLLMRSIVRLAALAVFVGVLAMSNRAEAAKIPIILTSGQESFESGPLPAPYDAVPELAGATAGYVCDVSGVFWSYYAIDNCRAAAIRGDRFDDSPALAAAIE